MIQRLSSFGVGLLAAVAIGQNAGAQTRSTPADNGRILAGQGALLGTHIAATVGGFAPFPVGLISEVIAYSSDLGLKATPPAFRPPADLALDPNKSATGSAATFTCVYRFADAVPTNDGRASGIQTEYGAIFGIPYNPLDRVWGDLGNPFVQHLHASVGVSVDNPYLALGGYAQYGPAQQALLEKVPEFPEGRHALRWRAATSMNAVLDVTVPAVLIAGFGYAEYRSWAKAAATAAKQGGKRFDDIVEAASVGAELGLIATDVGDVFSAYKWYRDTSFTTAINSATQTLTVWDVHLPFIRDTQTAATILEQSIELEATDFGGVRFGRVKDDLRARFTPVDNCGRSFETVPLVPDSTLLKVGGTQNFVTWEAREIDGGPYKPGIALAPNQRLESDNVVTTLVQRVTVVDTQAPILVPPSGFARYSSTSVDLTQGTFPLGRPRVVDLADPAPAVTNDAPDVLEVGRRYEIAWQATDASGNATEPGAHTQTVTIKAPGTNTAPSATPGSAATLTSQPVEVLLTGVDNDLIDGRVDPLAFEIDDYPPHGQFEAPLLPYFIEDFRLTPVGEREDERTATRTSPLKHLAEAFAGADPATHGTFLKQQICDAVPGTQNEIEFGNTIPVNFVYEPTYVHVDDDGFYYIRDKFWVCGEADSRNPDARADLRPIPRLSKWTDDGDLVALRPLHHTDSELYENPLWSTRGFPTDDFSVDHAGRLWVEITGFPTAGGSLSEFYSFDSSLADPRFHGAFGSDEGELTSGDRLVAIAGDARLGLLYELRRNADCDGFCIPEFSHSIVVRSADAVDNLALEEDIIGRIPLRGLAGQLPNGLALDIKVDSRGSVYVLETVGNRIHKFSPTERNDAGEWELGEHLGWLGSCTANLLDPNGVPFNDCDEQLGVSRGYACTDATCARAADTSGMQHGQFDAPESIEIDPRDILYVADTGNSRVQRFGPDGTFAGEAKSTGSGVNQGDDPGFILGNMGQPKQLAVNSSSFYVMEPDPQNGDNFVHVFKTLPFYDVTDASAKVKYVSTFDFQGTDTFTYIVNDGIDRSAPAAVNVTVSRAFRPPERLQSQCFADDTLAAEIACTLPEDGSIVVRFSAYDFDGFVSTGGLDTLTFNVLELPANGTLALLSTTDNAAVYRYTPDANYNGADELSFEAFDGVDASAEQKRVKLTITPTPDPVTIEFPDDLKAARGFEHVFSIRYSDLDADDVSDPTAATLAWGDGVTASAPGWANSGRRDSNGREIGPQEKVGLASGLLVGGHTYAATGNYTLSVTMQNAPAEGLPDTTATANVEVVQATVVGAKLASPGAAVDPDTPFALVVDVTNFAPQGWEGLIAEEVQATLIVPEGLTLATLDPRCTRADVITCELDDLAPGQTTSMTFGALISLAAARAATVYDLPVELVDVGPKLQDTTRLVLAVQVADRDGDGVIDADDAFPDDADYAVDTDGDGLPDEWETAHGFDPSAADDAAFDDDGDGFTLAQEFANGSYPLLGERQTAAPAAFLETDSTAEDRFGQAIAGGDLNQDGYDDTVIGAPFYGGTGAAFIAYGGPDGAGAALVRIDPASGMTQFGRSVEVADLDGNGYPEIAIGSNNAVSIHVNNGEILSTPDLVLDGATAQANFGVYLAAGDLDGDAIADLVATGRPAGNGEARIYFSKRGFLTAPLELTGSAATFGESAAIADIDGDGTPDLVVGGTGQVHGFLAAHNDWENASTLTLSFALVRAGSFGFSLASGADIGGDGIADLVVGAYEGAGQVLVYDSSTAYWDVAVPGETSSVPPTQILGGNAAGAGDNGFGDQLGVRVVLGHLDTDAFADVVAGGNRAGPNDAGVIRIYRGSPTGLLAPQIEAGATDFDMLGYFVAIPGDVNGDGFADVAAGAPEIATAQHPTASRGYVRVYEHAFAALDPAEDPDGDGVRDAVDNCAADANTNQADVDGDGAGDVCDTDADGDGLLNAVDNCPLIASADQTNSDTDAHGDLCDSDDDNDDVADVDDPFPTDARYSADTDADGMPDEYETEHGLDLADAADALADLDSDGRTNLDEFLAGSDVAADDIAPVLSAPADVVVDSIGPYTAVALGVATATDAKDGALAAVPSDPGPFAPGRHVVEWRATDAAGNTAVDSQQVDVIPRVDFLGTVQYAGEGAVVSATAVLNGTPVSYPVSVPYTISGTATDGVDYLVHGTLDISIGERASLDFEIATDTDVEGEETIVVTMGTPINAIAGNSAEHQIRIVETNLAPFVYIKTSQAAAARTTFVASEGPVLMTAVVIDPNPFDGHTFDWSGTDPALVPSEGFNAQAFTFDPAGLAEGVYAVRVRVTDDGAASTDATRYVKIVATAPPLDAGTDSDGDGIDDAAEGLTDQNGNGISDYLEPTAARHWLTAQTGTLRVLQARPGLTLELGAAALASGTDAQLTLAEVASYGADGRAALNAAEPTFDYPTGIFDFSVHGLAAPGDSAEIVLALPGPLPAGATYRKYLAQLGWDDFTVDAGNAVGSAAGAPGACPAPGGADYTAGLTAGHNCVLLVIEDGGPNDGDGTANRALHDPSGAAVPYTPPTVTVAALPAANASVSAGAADTVLLRFRLTSDSAAVSMDALTLSASGTGNDSTQVRAVKLWLDANADGSVDSGDVELGSGVYGADNGTLDLVLAAPYTLPLGTADFLVTYDL